MKWFELTRLITGLLIEVDLKPFEKNRKHTCNLPVVWVDEDGAEVEIGGAIVEDKKIKIFSQYTAGEAELKP